MPPTPDAAPQLTLDDLRLSTTDPVRALTFLRVVNRLLVRIFNVAQRSADLKVATVSAVGTSPNTLTVDYGDGTSDVCRYVDVPAAKVPIVGDRVVVVIDTNRSVVIGRLA